MASVYIFNAMNVPIKIIFNSGAPISVSGTGESAQWVPVSPASSAEPVFVNNGSPEAGQIGLGENTMTVYPASLPPAKAKQVTVNIPQNMQINSLQFYIFWASATAVSWIVLQQGQPIGGSLVIPTHEEIKAHHAELGTG